MATELSDLRALFVDEAREYIQMLNDGLLRLESEPQQTAVLHELFRAAHSLKGMAATVGLHHMVELAHALESVLDRMRAEPVADAAIFDLLFECTAVLERLVDEAAGNPEAREGLHEEVERLVQAVAQRSQAGWTGAQAAEAEAGPSAANGQHAEAGAGLPAGQAKAGHEGAAGHNRPPLSGTAQASVQTGPACTPAASPTASLAGGPGGGPAGGPVGGPPGLQQGLWFVEAGQLEQVRRAVAEGQSVFVVEVVLHPDCVFKGARAFTVWRALQALGTVVGSWPGREALLDERFEDRFLIGLVSPHGAAQVQAAALAVPEVKEARVQAVSGSSDSVQLQAGAPENGAAGRAAQATAPAPVSSAPGQGQAPTAEDGTAAGAAALPAAGGLSGPGGAGSAGAAGTSPARESTVRVETGRLDALVDLVGELVITTNQLQDAWQSRRVPDEAQMRKLGRVTSDLQSAVMRLRMVPLRQVFSRFPRTVRDLARRFGKQVQFVVEGEETELDRNIVNEIGDPLLHLLRNAIDHGIEPPEQRIAQGKPPVGRVRLSAYHEGNHVVIELEDDGAGIDVERIRQKAVASGRLSAEQAQAASADELLQLIFEPGFSTASQVTDVSGRGVGMDAARSAVESLGGRLSVQTRPGRGTLCTIRLPLTLAVIRALLVECGDEVYALPAETVSSIERAPADAERVRGKAVMRYRGRVVPLVDLRERLGLAQTTGGQAKPSGNGQHAGPSQLPGSQLPGTAGSGGLAVVLSTGRRTAAVAVDRVVGLQEIVIRSLSGYASVPGVAGATILGSGRVALILDAVWLL